MEECFSTEMNGHRFLRRPRLAKACRADDDDDDDDDNDDNDNDDSNYNSNRNK
jgi:hypothetical protein